jgi:hypothetical protein
MRGYVEHLRPFQAYAPPTLLSSAGRRARVGLEGPWITATLSSEPYLPSPDSCLVTITRFYP